MSVDQSQCQPSTQQPDPDPEPLFWQPLKEAAKYKTRSAQTHDENHVALLAKLGFCSTSSNETTEPPITTLLLGTSMLERFLTTGHFTQFGTSNPPEIDPVTGFPGLPSADTQTQFPTIFNAGVGGDRICNVAYRLVVKGLLMELKRVGGFQFAMIDMGTNDFRNDDRALTDRDIGTYELTIEALRWASPGVRICVCGLKPKKTVKKAEIVEASNVKLEQMVDRIDQRDRLSRAKAEGKEMEHDQMVEFLPCEGYMNGCHEDDGVHLNAKGYEIMGNSLWKNLEEMEEKALLAER